MLWRFFLTLLFAEISDAVWLALIGAVSLLIQTIVKDWLDRKRAKETKDKVEQTAAKVEETKVVLDSKLSEAAARVDKVKEELQQTTVERKVHEAKTEAAAENVRDMVSKVAEIHVATNSMKDELVKKTEQEALHRGMDYERERRAQEEEKGGQSQ